MKRGNWMSALAVLLLVMVWSFSVGCGSSGKSDPPPSISDLNSSTTPSGPVSLAIEINGNNFQSAPGQVIFTQGNIVATVTPNASGWSNNSIIAVVPLGNGSTSFIVPGTVTVTVKTAGGTSNGVALALVQNVTFNVNNITWTTTTRSRWR